MRTQKPGRPRKYHNALEMQEKMDEYFADCEKSGRGLTVQGLASYLGFGSTESLRKYTTQCKAKAHFSVTIKRAVLRIEADKARRLVECRDAGRAKGLIFDLKVNHGWREPARRVAVEQREEPKVQELSWSEWMERFGQGRKRAAG